MEFLPDLETLTTTLGAWTTRVMSFDPPIPDAALILAFILAVYAIKLAGRSTRERARSDIEALYQSELLLANRRAQQARGDLRKAHLAMERERQKRRRDAGRADMTGRRKNNLLVLNQSTPQT